METNYTVADCEAIKFLINHIDNIDEAYMCCLSSLLEDIKTLKKHLCIY